MQRTTVKVTLEDGDHFTTTINTDLAGARAYYRDFIMVTEDENGKETKRRVVKINAITDYLSETLAKIAATVHEDGHYGYDLRSIEYAVKDPSIGWTLDEQAILLPAIERRRAEIA